MEQWKLAKTYFEKSMSEHRTPEIKTLLSEVEKKIVEEEKKAYVDPVKAEQEKELGNEFFKQGQYGGRWQASFLNIIQFKHIPLYLISSTVFLCGNFHQQ